MSLKRSFVVSAVVFALLAVLSPTLHANDLHDATPEELAMKSLPSAPGAPAALLEWVRHHDATAAQEWEYKRIKIFTDEGKKFADVELAYVPGFSSIRSLRIRTIRPDGTIAPHSGKVYDKLIVKARGVKVMARTFTFSDVQPGSILEYRYTRTWPPEYLLPSRWAVQTDIPVLKESIWMKPYEKEFSSFFSHYGLPSGKVPVRVGDHYELQLADIPAFDTEPYMPPEETLKSRVEFFYTVSNANPPTYWRDTSRRWTDLIEGFIGDRSSIRAAANRIVGDAQTPDEKLRKLYAHVQSLRNLSYEKLKSEQEEKREKLRENRHIDDVLTNGYGSSIELNRLFAGLARAAGVPATIICLSERDEFFFSHNLPVSSQLTDEVVEVEIDGKPLYLDPGTPFAPYGVLPWPNTNVSGFRIAKKSKDVQWMDTPEQRSTVARLQRRADLRLDAGIVKGNVRITFTGQEALTRRLEGRHDDDELYKKSLEDELKGWLPEGSTVKVSSIEGLRGIEEPIVLQADVELPNLGSAAGSRTLLPLSVFAVRQKTPFSSQTRKHPIYFTFAHEVDDEVKLALPEGYRIESIPGGDDMNLGALTFNSTTKKDDTHVTLQRKLAVNALLVDSQRYATVRTFFSRIVASDQETLVLRKTK